MIDLHRFSLIFTDVLMISMFHLIFIQFQHFYINFQLFIFVCHRFVTEFHRLSDDFHLFALMWIIYDLSYVFHVSSILIVFQVVVDVELLLSIVIGYYQISLTVMDFNRFFTISARFSLIILRESLFLSSVCFTWHRIIYFSAAERRPGVRWRIARRRTKPSAFGRGPANCRFH